MRIVNSLVQNQKWFGGLLMMLVMITVPGFSFAGPDDRAKIITGNEKPAECISSVQVNAIDGKQVYKQPLGFDIEPGKHTITARAVINTSFCTAVGPATGKNTAEPLEAEFEAGKTYYVGYDHSSSNRKDWKLVIWKVEG